jgi:hypothetical protein
MCPRGWVLKWTVPETRKPRLTENNLTNDRTPERGRLSRVVLAAERESPPSRSLAPLSEAGHFLDKKSRENLLGMASFNRIAGSVLLAALF